MSVHFSSQSNEWSTPQIFFDRLNDIYNFTLDPCSDGKNNKCIKYFTQEDDGLLKDWGGERVFMNPPYGRGISNWVEKARNESKKLDTLVVGLIPARTDTMYWHKHIFGIASEIIFLKGRLKFGDGKNSAPFPSAVIVWGGGSTVVKTMDSYIKEG